MRRSGRSTRSSMASVGKLSGATGQVRGLVMAALRNPAGLVELTSCDLDLTIRLMRRARLLGRMAWQAREQGFSASLPRTAADHLLSALASTEARERVARWELNRLNWALDDLPAVPLVTLKGCAYLLASLPNARGRSFADVDLLVPQADLQAVETQLRARGWQASELSAYDERYYRRWAHELPPMIHPEREVETDLHHNILMATSRLKPKAALLLGEARAVPGSRYRVLAPADMVLHAMTHLMFGEDLADALRELVDIDDLLRHFGKHEPGFWTRFWPRAEQLDLARPAFYGLRYAGALLGTPVPAAVAAASRAGAPPTSVIRLMDQLVPQALFPAHPDAALRRTGLARTLLYVRSHWIRMPAPMLARHLGYKAWLRVRRTEPRGA